MEKHRKTKEAKIYLAMKKRADELFEYSMENPAWEEVAWDAEEELAIYALQNEDKIFE